MQNLYYSTKQAFVIILHRIYDVSVLMESKSNKDEKWNLWNLKQQK